MLKNTNVIHSIKTYLFIIFIATLSLFSCNQNDYKAEKENIETLQRELAIKDSMIATIANEGQDLKTKAITLQNLSGRKYVQKDHYSFLLTHKDVLIDKKSIVKAVIEELDLKDNDIMYQLYNLVDINNKDDYSLEDQLGAIIRLWYSVDRSPKAIKTFLTKEDKIMLINFLKSNSIYKDSGISNIAQALLTSYKEIEDYDHSKSNLEDLKIIIYEEEHYNYETGYDSSDEERRLIQELSSDKVYAIISKENYSVHKDSESKVENRLRFIYTFWARRLKEGNKEVVYSLIKELHEGITE